MPSAFYTWLETADPVAACFFKQRGLPTQSSRLYVLLRQCKNHPIGEERQWVKRLHREWRKARISYEVFRFTPEMIAEASQNASNWIEAFGSTLPTREITLNLNFVPNTPDGFPLIISIASIEGLPATPPDIEWFRWRRVMRRWEAKHKPCPQCNGDGWIAEDHGIFVQELLECGYCFGSGKA